MPGDLRGRRCILQLDRRLLLRFVHGRTWDLYTARVHDRGRWLRARRGVLHGGLRCRPLRHELPVSPDAVQGAAKRAKTSLRSTGPKCPTKKVASIGARASTEMTFARFFARSHW